MCVNLQIVTFSVTQNFSTMAASDANFLYNVMLAKALVQLIPAHGKSQLVK